MQLQRSFTPLVSFSSLSSVVNRQLLVTNKGRSLCWEGDKLILKYIFVETLDFLLLWEFSFSSLHSFEDSGVQNSWTL